MKIPAMVIGFATGQNLSFGFVIVALLFFWLPVCMYEAAELRWCHFDSAMRRLIRLYKGFFRQVVLFLVAWLSWDRWPAGRPATRPIAAVREQQLRAPRRGDVSNMPQASYSPSSKKWAIFVANACCGAAWWKMISFYRQTAHELLYRRGNACCNATYITQAPRISIPNAIKPMKLRPKNCS